MLAVVAAAVAVDDAAAGVAVAREMRSAVAADDRKPAAEAGDGVVVVDVLVQLADGDVEAAVVVVETSANISEPMLDETSPAPAADDWRSVVPLDTGPDHTSQLPHYI